MPFSAGGITLERSVSTRSAVAWSAGPVVAIALKYAVVPALSICIGVTAATPAVFETSALEASAAAGLWRAGRCPLMPTTEDPTARPAGRGLRGRVERHDTISGPFTPGPKLFEIRS